MMKLVLSISVLLAGIGIGGCGSSDSGDDAASGGSASDTDNTGGSAAEDGSGGAANTSTTGGGAGTDDSASATVLAPVDGSAWSTDCYDDDPSDTKVYYVARGGGVSSDAEDVRASARMSAMADGYGTVQMGFRCVSTAETLDASVEWVPIAAGTFVMGCSDGDAQCNANESPAHSVTLGAFSMMTTEVVSGDWAARGVSYTAASDHCASIGGRLPTEAEWEYAARAGTTGALPCTDDCTLDSIAWYADNIEAQNAIDNTDPFATTSGGQKAANAWGLYDMLGNAPEWVQDCYHTTY